MTWHNLIGLQGVMLRALSLHHAGCASGNYQGWMDNSRPEFHDAFVEYLVMVVKHYRDNFGLNFRTLDPFNESTSTWWQRGGAQEGCHFGTRKPCLPLPPLVCRIHLAACTL